MTVEVTREVSVSSEAAFDGVADVRNEVQWNSQVTDAQLVSGLPIGQGTRFTTINRGALYDATITVYERPRRLGFDVTGKAMDISGTFEFQSVGAQRTRMTARFSLQPKGFMKIVMAVIGPMVRNDFPRQYGRLAAWLEGR